jgi:hypothetical protein
MVEKNSYKKEILRLSQDNVLRRIIQSIYSCWNRGLKPIADEYLDVLFRLYPDEFENAVVVHRYVDALHSFNTSRTTRKQRLKAKINKWRCEYYVCFVTLTFNDDFLNYSSFEHRKEKVREVLNESCIDYVANIDFGEKKGREHYHAICCGLKDYALKNLWKYGYFKIEPLRDGTEGKVIEYIDKLCNHAVKDSVGFSTLMYCRKKSPPTKCHDARVSLGSSEG